MHAQKSKRATPEGRPFEARSAVEAQRRERLGRELRVALVRRELELREALERLLELLREVARLSLEREGRLDLMLLGLLERVGREVLLRLLLERLLVARLLDLREDVLPKLERRPRFEDELALGRRELLPRVALGRELLLRLELARLSLLRLEGRLALERELVPRLELARLSLPREGRLALGRELLPRLELARLSLLLLELARLSLPRAGRLALGLRELVPRLELARLSLRREDAERASLRRASLRRASGRRESPRGVAAWRDPLFGRGCAFGLGCLFRGCVDAVVCRGFALAVALCTPWPFFATYFTWRTRRCL